MPTQRTIVQKVFALGNDMRRLARFLDLALKDAELLPEQGVRKQELGLGTREIAGRAEGGRGSRQPSPVEIELLQPGGRERSWTKRARGTWATPGRLSKSIKSFRGNTVSQCKFLIVTKKAMSVCACGFSLLKVVHLQNRAELVRQVIL